MTREQILNLQVGDKVAFTMDTKYGKVLPGARYSAPRKVVEIFAQEVSPYHGKAYVCFYTELGEFAKISGSCTEEEEFYKVVN